MLHNNFWFFIPWGRHTIYNCPLVLTLVLFPFAGSHLINLCVIPSPNVFTWSGYLPAPQQLGHALKTHSTALQHSWLYFVVGCGRSETYFSCSEVWLPYHLLKQVLSTEDSSVPMAAAIKC